MSQRHIRSRAGFAPEREEVSQIVSSKTCECKVTPHLLLVSEVLGDVEHITDFLRRLALDHVSHSLATNIAIRHKLDESLQNKETGGWLTGAP